MVDDRQAAAPRDRAPGGLLTSEGLLIFFPAAPATNRHQFLSRSLNRPANIMTPISFASSAEPRHHPDCCMAISQPLLHNLANILPRGPAISVLSIGSGTGLLESLLLQMLEDSYDICGVEVSPAVNKYLPEQNMFFVGGTWDLCPQAGKSHVWIFTYPREPKLIVKYLELHDHASLSKIIWLGPKMDWQDYEGVFASSRFSLTVLEDCGAATYEMVVVAEPQVNGP
ncbi:unnamed protein product [Aureobasidium mustum]|uniref:S-adenosyl-L-methionine-dependent methyltransferase n=1 Tax=Aureobasidium mustum TaxID=2773714 RepID=A0A9N8JX50_9PEZI|nr:unnamed protein product [Aureobasidium mustum]